MRVTPKEIEKLDKVIKEYPETFDWMKRQADCRFMSLSKVLHEITTNFFIFSVKLGL